MEEIPGSGDVILTDREQWKKAAESLRPTGVFLPLGIRQRALDRALRNLIGPDPTRRPLPPGTICRHDHGVAVAQIHWSDGTIEAVCLDHDHPELPPPPRPAWWRRLLHRENR